jgi:hypothetical protein
VGSAPQVAMGGAMPALDPRPPPVLPLFEDTPAPLDDPGDGTSPVEASMRPPQPRPHAPQARTAAADSRAVQFIATGAA